MPLSPKVIIALLVFLILWILWCFFVFNAVMPWVELHVAVWHWLAAWILSLIPLFILTAVVATRVSKNRR